MEWYKKQKVQRIMPSLFRDSDLSKKLYDDYGDCRINAVEQFKKLSSFIQMIDLSLVKHENMVIFPPHDELIIFLTDICNSLKLCPFPKYQLFGVTFFKFIVCTAFEYHIDINILDISSQIIKLLSLHDFPEELIPIVQHFELFIYSHSTVIQKNFIVAFRNFLFDKISFKLLKELNFHNAVFAVIETSSSLDVISCSFDFISTFVQLDEKIRKEADVFQSDDSDLIYSILIRTMKYINSSARIEFLPDAFLTLAIVLKCENMIDFALENNLIDLLHNILTTNDKPELFLAACRLLIDICPSNSVFQVDSFYSRYELLIFPFELPTTEEEKLIGVNILSLLVTSCLNCGQMIIQSGLYHTIIVLTQRASFSLKVEVCELVIAIANQNGLIRSLMEISVDDVELTADLMVNVLSSGIPGVCISALTALAIFARDYEDLWIICAKLQGMTETLQEICDKEENDVKVVGMASALLQKIELME